MKRRPLITTEEDLLYEVEGRVARITLNRPESLNALTFGMMKRWREVMIAFNEDPEPLVGIVRGAGERAFCVGMDLKQLAAIRAEPREEPVTRTPPIPVIPDKPLIAAIDGYCIGGGLELALQCDIRVATPRSQFGLPEARWNVPGSYGLHMLNRMIPLGEALHMQFTGSRIDGERAYAIGLVQRLAEPDKLEEEAHAVAEGVLSCAPLAIKAIKRVVMESRHLPLSGRLRLCRAAGARPGQHRGRQGRPPRLRRKAPPELEGPLGGRLGFDLQQAVGDAASVALRGVLVELEHHQC